MFPLTLSGSVGYDQDNDPNDIAQTGTALATLGHFDALGAVRSGSFDDGLDKAIRNYQSGNDLEPDGVLLPNGPTQTSLNGALRDHRPGPSLLLAEDDPSPAGDRPQTVAPRNTAENPSRENLRTDDRVPSRSSIAAADFDMSRDPLNVSDRAARNPVAAQKGAAGLLDSVLGGLIAASRGASAGEHELEQIMKIRGYRYVPDPMGRIDEGDWVNGRGDRVGPDEARAITRHAESNVWRRAHSAVDIDAGDDRSHGVRIVTARASAPARRIESNIKNLADDLDTATAYVKRGEGNVRVVVPVQLSSTAVDTAGEVSRINAGILEAVVGNALLNRQTGPEEIAAVAGDIAENRAHRPQTGRSRIKDMLTEAALNGATPEQRLHARGLLAVHEMEEREAKAAGRSDPRAGADAALAAFAAGLAGDVSWSVQGAEEDYEDEENEGDGGVELAQDEPDNPRRPRPRGMQNENTREAAREGRRRHAELKERIRTKGRGWGTGSYRDEAMGRRVYPDVTTRRGYLLEYKPDTPSGRAAGEKQCAEYTRVTRKRCRVIYYRPGPDSGSRGGAGVQRFTPPWGVGSNRLGSPKLPGTHQPRELLK